MAIKLWIDDIRTPPDSSWHICRNVTSALKALTMFWAEVTEINLDHDISHQIVMGTMSRPYGCSETFQAVAIHLAALKIMHPHWEPKIRIHTSNYTGAREMGAILHEFKNVDTAIAPGANRLETIL